MVDVYGFGQGLAQKQWWRIFGSVGVCMWSALDCEPSVFNIVIISGYYAAMAGILAGFAFIALVVFLTPIQVEERWIRPIGDGGDVFLTFLVAFVALMVLILIYSVLAGEDVEHVCGRAATQELVDGLLFGLAVIMLFYGLTLFVGRERVRPLSVWTLRTFITVVCPVLVMFYFVNGIIDTEEARVVRHVGACANFAPYCFGIVLMAVMSVVLLAGLVVLACGAVVLCWVYRWWDVVLVLVLALSVVSVVFAGDLAIREFQFLFSIVWIYTYLVIASIVLIIVGLMLTTAYQVLRPALAFGLLDPSRLLVQMAGDDDRSVSLRLDLMAADHGR